LEDYSQAIEDFSWAVAVDPYCADAYWLRGLAYNNVFDYEKSIQDFSRVIEFEQDEIEAYIDRGNT